MKYHVIPVEPLKSKSEPVRSAKEKSAPSQILSYPIPLDKLQDEPASSMAPTQMIEKILDFQHGERGRLTYNCEQQWYLAGACSKSEKVANQ